MTGEREFDLAAVRADGWFERLGATTPQFGQLCGAIGDKTVAFSIIAGVQITGVQLVRGAPEESLVEYVMGGNSEQVTLAEFRVRLADALTSIDLPGRLPADVDVEALRSFVGLRVLLLSPLYGLRLHSVKLGPDSPTLVTIEMPDESLEPISLDELRGVLSERVQADMRPPPQFSLDMEVVAAARQADANDDWEVVISLLENWAGPLSMLLRSREGASLPPETRGELTSALAFLATALAALGEEERSDECFTLGAQWGQLYGGKALADLFLRFGRSLVDREKHGQAIGMLRRALDLSAPSLAVYTVLARAYSGCECWLAAALCAERALAPSMESRLTEPAPGQDAKTADPSGSVTDASEPVSLNNEQKADETQETEALLARCTTELGVAWTRFRAEIPGPS